MDKAGETLISLVSLAVRGQDIERNNSGGIGFACVDWARVHQEARAHEVHTLIYPLVKNLSANIAIDNELMEKWKKSVVASQAQQVQLIHRVGEVLESFNASGIPVIALKGLTIRNLYPNPELRTMGDADFLIHIEDIERAKKLLLDMGYYIDGPELTSPDQKHIHFTHERHFDIELHTFITTYDRMKDLPYVESLFWKNAIPFSICGVPTLRLSDKDEILHLCLHMSSHLKSGGFGLRQLCDLALKVESCRETVDWKAFYDRCRTYGISGFVNAIFIICSKLLNLQLSYSALSYSEPLNSEPLNSKSLSSKPVDSKPLNSIHEKPEYDRYISMLADDILAGGLFGKRGKERRVANLLVLSSQDKMNEQHSTRTLRGHTRILNQLRFIFPPSEKLKGRYSYAQKYPILTPVAWSHRLIRGMLRKDFSLSQKYNCLIPTGETKAIVEQRTELLQWLQLQ